MFGIGGTELLLILVVALIVLGPKSVPQISRTLGRAMGEFRRVSTEFQRTLNTELELEEHDRRKKEAEQELYGPDAASSTQISRASQTVKATATQGTSEAEEKNRPGTGTDLQRSTGQVSGSQSEAEKAGV